MCKKSIKNSQPFVKKNQKCQDPSGGDFFDSHCSAGRPFYNKINLLILVLITISHRRYSSHKHIHNETIIQELLNFPFCTCSNLKASVCMLCVITKEKNTYCSYCTFWADCKYSFNHCVKLLTDEGFLVQRVIDSIKCQLYAGCFFNHSYCLFG